MHHSEYPAGASDPGRWTAISDVDAPAIQELAAWRDSDEHR